MAKYSGVYRELGKWFERSRVAAVLGMMRLVWYGIRNMDGITIRCSLEGSSLREKKGRVRREIKKMEGLRATKKVK